MLDRPASSSLVHPPVLGAAGGALEGRTILQIVPRLDGGGAEQTTLDIASALVGAGARAVVASEGGRLVADLQARGGVFAPFPAAAKNPLVMALAAPRLRRLMAAEGADLVHVRSRAPGWVALSACRGSRTPLVTTWHGAYGGRSAIKQRYNSVMARGDVVIANSQWTAGVIARSYPDAAPRLATIPRGVDLRAFSPAAVAPARVRRLRSDWNLEPGDRMVLAPARLARRKGHLILVQAARKLKEGGDRLVFIFAGDADGHGSVRGEIERAAKSAGLGDAVRCVGVCADMPAAYLAASAVVVPSVEPEAFGRVSVEAQAMGAPVVVTDLGAAPETVLAPPDVSASQRTGWRVKPGDPKALADGLTEALALGAAARDALARRGRAFVASRFSLERMTGVTLEIYARLIEHAARSAQP